MVVSLQPASEFSAATLAGLFTDAYEGYFVPIQLDEAAFTQMVKAFDLDLDRSVVALDGDSPIGLGNLGLRGTRTWLGGVGVVPARRGTGVGELLTRALLGRARDAGANGMVLEVIVENAPAIGLYEKLGFARGRELEILSLPADGSGGTAEEIPVDAACALIAARRDGPEPWQREAETIANLGSREQPPRALVAGDAAAVYRVDGGRVSLLQAAGGETGLNAIVAALRALGPLSALNFPAGGTVSSLLRAAGASVPLRQYEMAVAL